MTMMKDLKQERQLSIERRWYVLACLAIVLLGIVIIRMKFPTLKNQLSDTLFIGALFAALINVFSGRK